MSKQFLRNNIFMGKDCEMTDFREESFYDQVPYDSHPHFETHPSRIAAAVRLFSLPIPDVQISRILELGCASGGNLIPMAMYYPDARFLGVDISGVQINDGNARIAALEYK